MDKKDSEVSSKNIESSESSIENEAKEDTLSKSIGELGRWQIFLIVIVIIPCQMTSAWNMLSIIFLAPKTKYRCISRLNSTEGIFNGTCYDDCEEYEYTTDFSKNIITEFGLICGRAWLANLTQTLFMFGVLVGSMVFGFIADRYGRRKAILTTSMLQMTLSLLLPFSPEYWTFTTIRFLLGTSTAGSLIIAYVFVIEIVGPSKREVVGSVCHIPFLLGEMIMPVIAYYLRSWKSFALGIGIPNLVFLLHIFLLPESPRWLISMGRLEEASAVMKRAAKWNNLPTKNILEAAKNIAKESNENCNQVEHKSISYIDLISNSRLRMRNLLSCVSWFILSLSFYGVTQYIGQTSTSVFITMTLVGGWQIPSMLGSGYLSKRYGRRSVIIGFLLISSVCSGLLALPDSWFYTKIAVGAIGTGCAAGAFNIMYVFTSELFPTVARNMAMGVSSTVSRFGSMLAPFVAGTSQGAWVPPLVFAAAPLVAAGVCWCLPETKGRKLTDRLVDE